MERRYVDNVRVPGDPTGRIAPRLTSSKQLNYLIMAVEVIDRVYNALRDDYKNLVRVKYWFYKCFLGMKCKVSKRQAMRWRDVTIQATMEGLGWR